MAKNERKRQKALERHRIKRQKVQSSGRSVSSSSSSVNIRAAATWPVRDCWITSSWQTEGQITQLVVAREAPAGTVAAGVFLVDLACLGVKNAFWNTFPTDYDYRHDLLDPMMGRQPMVKTDINTAAKVLREAVAYARQWDIRPDPDYTQASKLLGDADPEASNVHVPLGISGKPGFISGPHDNVALIIEKLERTAGSGNYTFMAGGPGMTMLFGPDEDEDEEDQEDEDDTDDEAYDRGAVALVDETSSELIPDSGQRPNYGVMAGLMRKMRRR